jgi:3-oxoisoapionate decarboxylase
MLRRSFLTGAAPSAAALAAGAAAQSPAPALSASPVPLGFDTYSLRAFHWKAMDLLDYCDKLKLDAIQLSSLSDFESLDAAHLERVRDRARRSSIAIDAGIGCICPTSKSFSASNGAPEEYVAKGLAVAKAVGARSLRVFMGSSADRKGTPIEKHIDATVKVLRACRPRALDAGMKIAVENHSGDMQAWELRELIEAAGKDFVAACLDTGNPIWCVEDPLVTLEVLGPYTVTTHIRDSVVYEHPRGAAGQWVALGDGIIDFRRFVARFRELCPNSSMQLENITGRPPTVLPYLEDEFWTAFPKARAADFARFTGLARHGRPFSGAMIIADVGAVRRQPPEYAAALREQQRVDLERGLEYAKKTLNVGIRWRT